MPTPQLPPELLRDILDTVVLSYPSHAIRIPNLASFSLVNRTFHQIANPLLYRNLFLGIRHRMQIISTLSTNEELAKQVRVITVLGADLTVEEFEIMKTVLSGCENVSSFTYLCFDPWYLPSLTAFVAKTWSTTLKYLRSDQKEGLYDLLCRLPNLEELVVSCIDFPPSLTPSSTPSSSRSPSPSLATSTPFSPSSSFPIPTFQLKRFDSGSSPYSHNFEALTFTSRSSLITLDLPVSSRSPIQYLSLFPSLTSLTLTLSERYILHDLDAPQTRTRSERDDVRCLRQVKETLKGVRGSQLRSLEVYQPDYRRTRAFAKEDVEKSDLFEGIPQGVKELDLSTIEVGDEYLLRTFTKIEGTEEEEENVRCKGLTKIVLRQTERRKEVEECLRKRAIEVRWV